MSLDLFPDKFTLPVCLSVAVNPLSQNETQSKSVVNWLIERIFCCNRGTCNTLFKTSDPYDVGIVTSILAIGNYFPLPIKTTSNKYK